MKGSLERKRGVAGLDLLGGSIRPGVVEDVSVSDRQSARAVAEIGGHSACLQRLAASQRVHTGVGMLRPMVAHLVAIAVADLVQVSGLGTVAIARRRIIDDRSNIADLGRIDARRGTTGIGPKVAKI